MTVPPPNPSLAAANTAPLPAWPSFVAAGVGVVGVAVGVLEGRVHGVDVLLRSYILNYAFVLSLALGALFFVMLQHVTRAGWSVSLRRLAECTAATLPLLALLFLPILAGVLYHRGAVYPWSDPARVAADPLLQHKTAYLNIPFFVVRCVFYFALWSGLAVGLLRGSRAQDSGGTPAITLRMERWSAPGLLLFALTTTLFSIDVLMSLNPHWYSTIWGVYFFSGSAVGFFALLALLAAGVQRAGRLRGLINAEHYHDVGKLAFGFVVFWAYIAFSQYMLMWYANLPEETAWYQARQSSPWWVGVSLLLLFGHFVAPFLAMISRYPKRRPGLLALAAVWLLVMHWLDLYYVVAPTPAGHESAGVPLHVGDVALLVGLAGLLAAGILRQLARHTLLPIGDPRLPEALAFHNV